MPDASPRAIAGALLVFDVTRRESFEGLPAWLAEVGHYASSSRVARLLVGHKADAGDAGEAGEAGARRAVSAEEAAAFAAAHSMTYVEASAKSAAGVQESFEALVLQAPTPLPSYHPTWRLSRPSYYRRHLARLQRLASPLISP